MSDLTRQSAATLASAIARKEVSSEEVTKAHLDRISQVDERVRAFLHVDRESSIARAREVDQQLAKGELSSPLAGVPIALKDLLATKGVPTTCGSRILEGWRPPYNATIVDKLNAAGVVSLGKTNMDEFAMGSSTEHSGYGPTHNPWDLTRIPGGSGGGSAAAVASFESPMAIGTDTGGSIRQPAALTGTVGVKPTYGGVSRYGIVALASSLDQAGPCARDVMDTALLHAVIAGHDPRDSTSINEPVPDVVAAALDADVRGMKIGVIKELKGEGFQAGVLERFNQSLEILTELGAEVIEVSCPHFEYALGAYYLILPSEASSNLARFDGMRFGIREDDGKDRSVEQVMSATREKGFGAEVKRRIMLGTYALSSGYYDAYYGQAQRIRTLITRDFADAFSHVDVLVSPTAPTTAFKIGEKLDDPLAMYLNDIATIPVNLAGNCAMSLPIGRAPEDGLPVGLQIIAPPMADHFLISEAPTL
jgi:aspartyl-tRNA(Asn)/glutamyl-tRNA(Gln) amidotransferase subunit A